MGEGLRYLLIATAGPLVHGSNASLHAGEPWVARLGATWRIVTLDLPGHR